MSHNKLTAKQQGYLAQRIAGVSQTEAARAAGYSAKTATEAAARLERHPTIRRELELAQAATIADARVTLQSLLNQLQRAYDVAAARNNAGGMVMAATALAKLAGYWVEKSEDLTKREAVERSNAERRELKTAADWLGDAIESMGLPRDATPEMLVGANNERAFATPEMFKLLRATQQGVDDEGLL